MHLRVRARKHQGKLLSEGSIWDKIFHFSFMVFVILTLYFLCHFRLRKRLAQIIQIILIDHSSRCTKMLYENMLSYT